MKKIAELAVKSPATCGEGPLWDHRINKLLWIDIPNNILHIHNPEAGENTAEPLPERVSRLFIMGTDEYAAAVSSGIARLYKKDGIWKTEWLITLDENPDILSNDGECDSHGRLVLGLMHKDFTSLVGSLHLINGSKTQCFNRNIKIPNGAAWSTDEKDLYMVTNHPEMGILNYEYNPENGTIGELKEFYKLPCADGMCADCEGNLWVTLCGKGLVVCFNPKAGEIIRQIEVPVNTTTSCAFGGADMRTLFITSATWGKPDPEAPLRGSLFKVENMDVTGKKSYSFKW